MSKVTKIDSQKVGGRKRVAAYCRVSTDKDAQRESLKNQMEALQYQIMRHSDWELVKIYTDEGLSGTSTKGRIKFVEMIEDCRAGKIDYIITKSISRFARNTVDTLMTVRELQSYGVQMYFEKEGIDTSSVLSEMLLTVMASFAQEESLSISENVKWSIRKRYEEGRIPKHPLYGFYHTEDQLYQIVPEEAAVVREVFERFVHGELPLNIMKDMIARGVKPPAGNKWKRLQFNRMLKNEKYAGDVILQKSYVENHITHKQIRNNGKLPKFLISDAIPAIIDRHTFEQAQKIIKMRDINAGTCSYPYGEMLRCPHCGNTLVHGSLYDFYFRHARIQNGGWGCYGADGCGSYLIIQEILDWVVINAYAGKYGEGKEKVDYYWLDDTIREIELEEERVAIHWKDGDLSVEEMRLPDARYYPSGFADQYNDFLERVWKGVRKVKCRNLMGLELIAGQDMSGGANGDNQSIGEAEGES